MNTEVVCQFLLQWTTFYQNSPPWLVRPEWPYMASAHSFTELNKAVVHVIRLVSFLWLRFQSVWPIMVKVSRLLEDSWSEKLTEVEIGSCSDGLGHAQWVQWLNWIEFSAEFSHSVVSNSLRPYEPQHARPPCPSQTPGVYSNSCPSSWWCHPAISSCVIPFAFCPQSLPASGSFQMS